MIIYVNNRGEIKDVGSTKQLGLTAIIVPEEENPFEGWSVARILCYKILLDRDGNIGGYTPYIDSRIVEQLDKMGVATEGNTEDITANRDGLIETYDNTMSNSSDITECREAIIELYDMLMEE